MTSILDTEKTKSNVLSFKKFKKNKNTITSTIAAIVAINIEHPEHISPEDYFIENIQTNKNIELLAFEDALDELIDGSPIDKNNNTKNFVNDA